MTARLWLACCQAPHLRWRVRRCHTQTSSESPSLQMSAFLNIRRKEKEGKKMQMHVLPCSIGLPALEPNEGSRVSCWFQLTELKLVLVICISLRSEWRGKNMDWPFLHLSRAASTPAFQAPPPSNLDVSAQRQLVAAAALATNYAIVTAELQQQADGNNPPPRGTALLSKN